LWVRLLVFHSVWSLNKLGAVVSLRTNDGGGEELNVICASFCRFSQIYLLITPMPRRQNRAVPAPWPDSHP
jgi:hypothetical protein